MSADRSSAARMRARLVDAAIRLLTDEGPNAVQARRVASEVGASTMAVYHYWGGMSELLGAVVDEGFVRLGARISATPISPDPVADLCRIAIAYLGVATANKHLYDLMFGLSAPGGHRPDNGDESVVVASTAASDAYAPAIDAAARAMQAGRLRDADPAAVAAQFWSVLHGYASLASAGQFTQFDDSFAQVMVPLGINLLVGLGDTHERATRSAMQALADLRPAVED
ncbi:TetR/AcrR family transcriptional regulator [Actinomycetes bacterium KLBMP 9759]